MNQVWVSSKLFRRAENEAIGFYALSSFGSPLGSRRKHMKSKIYLTKLKMKSLKNLMSKVVW